MLHKITDDPELTRTHYQLIKFNAAANWTQTFEISEGEVRDWLQETGAPIDPPSPTVIQTETG